VDQEQVALFIFSESAFNLSTDSLMGDNQFKSDFNQKAFSRKTRSSFDMLGVLKDLYHGVLTWMLGWDALYCLLVLFQRHPETSPPHWV
jgi:hypothetical protein